MFETNGNREHLQASLLNLMRRIWWKEQKILLKKRFLSLSGFKPRKIIPESQRTLRQRYSFAWIKEDGLIRLIDENRNNVNKGCCLAISTTAVIVQTPGFCREFVLLSLRNCLISYFVKLGVKCNKCKNWENVDLSSISWQHSVRIPVNIIFTLQHAVETLE